MTTTQLEIERKFLMKPEFAQFVKTHDQGLELFIYQGYLAIMGDIEVRCRKSWNKAWAKGELTIKKGYGQLRYEQTLKIDWEVAEALIDNCGNWKLHKVRHRIFDRWEVDYYYDRHKELVIMEVEKLPEESDEAFNNLELPVECRPFLIREVTEEEVFKNRNLAVLVKTPK